MNATVRKLAEETEIFGILEYFKYEARIENFARALLEMAAKECDAEALKWKSPKYNYATASANHCAASIRAMLD